MQFLSVGGNFMFNLRDLYQCLNYLCMQIYIVVYIIHPCETSKIKSVNLHVQELFRSGSYRF